MNPNILRVMLLEPEAEIRHLLRDLLTARGHKIYVPRQIEDIDHILAEKKIDFCILDVAYAKDGCLDLLRKMVKADRNMSVVILGSDTDTGLADEATLIGATGFIWKGNSYETLTERIKAAMETSKQPKEALFSGKVMVVDDDPDMGNLLIKFLESRNYETMQVLSGEEAIKKANEELPKLVLLDFNMPGMNGLETFRELLKINPDIGVIMVTGNTDDQIWKEARELGAYDYVVKPVDLKYLDLVLSTKMMMMT